MKKFLENERKLVDAIENIFSDRLIEELYVRLDKFERMVIWCTYPELTLEEVEIIEEMMAQNYLAEEILEKMELDDRSDDMQEVVDTLC